MDQGSFLTRLSILEGDFDYFRGVAIQIPL